MSTIRNAARGLRADRSRSLVYFEVIASGLGTGGTIGGGFGDIDSGSSLGAGADGIGSGSAGGTLRR